MQTHCHSSTGFGLSRFYQQIDFSFGREIILRCAQQRAKRVLRMENADGQNQK